MLPTSSHAVLPMKEGSSRCQPMTSNLYIFMATNGSAKHQSAFRRGPVLLGGGIFFLPSWREVPALMSEFCTYLNTEWDGGDVFHLGAYALWRVAAIHPFMDGNGRVARSLCFALMRAKDGRLRPCRLDRREYIARLKQADQLFEETRNFRLSTAPVEEWLREVFEQKSLKDPSD
jgi:Fic family protein